VKAHTRREIEQATRDGEGFCLSCGSRQDFYERRLLLGLCEECGEQDVVEAGLLLRMFDFTGEGD
jgi:predicted amidophosphoribosyltransferase